MAARYESWDHRIQKIGNGMSSAWEGPVHYRLSNGGDRSPSDVFPYVHEYSATFVDSYDACYTTTNTAAPEIHGYSTPMLPSIRRDAWTANDDLKLLNKLRGKYDETKHDAGIAGAELGKNVDMLANRLRQAALAARQARRGNFAEALKTLGANASHVKQGRKEKSGRQNLADLNLEMQYGFRTLANDVYELAVSIDHDTRRTQYIRASRTIKGEIIPDPMFPCIGEHYLRKGYIGYLELDDPMLPERMGLVNPFGILWEVTPWSLIADWVLPIGDWIEAQSFALRARGIFIKTSKEYTRYRGSGHKIESGYIAYGPLGRWMRSSCSFSRTIHNTLPVPLPAWKSPLKSGEPIQRLANALSFLLASPRVGTRY